MACWSCAGGRKRTPSLRHSQFQGTAEDAESDVNLCPAVHVLLCGPGDLKRSRQPEHLPDELRRHLSYPEVWINFPLQAFEPCRVVLLETAAGRPAPRLSGVDNELQPLAFAVALREFLSAYQIW